MNNQTLPSVKEEYKDIPFIDILLPYTDRFLGKIQRINISIELLNKLNKNLLQEMSSVAEVTLQEELNNFKNNGGNFYPDFVELMHSSLAEKYPVLEKMLVMITDNYSAHIKNIFSNFSKDAEVIAATFSLKSNVIIKDIDTSLGDGHSGESTAMVILSDDTKLIYKPRNLDTAVSYNLFIDWVNSKLNTDLKTLKCINFENYGWLEFVNHEPVHSVEELKDYYYKSGILLAVTLLLGTKDCHYENVIASGNSPVIIDHETIIQPVLSDQPSIRTWDEQHKIPKFSVLESMLIANQDTGATLQCAGYGLKGNSETMDMEMKVIHPNTIDSKRDTRFVFRKMIKENLPFYNGEPVFVNDFQEFFLKGFSAAYDMFKTVKEELLSPSSPVNFFNNQKIRYVWRPTFVYFRILKYMRAPSFMVNFEAYRSKLYELMSKAYQKEGFKNLKFILDSEMIQMINGDIPFFNLNSLDVHLEQNEMFKIFEYNCVENIKQRINILSEEHKNEQIVYISKWLLIKS